MACSRRTCDYLVKSDEIWLLVNCSGLMKSYNLERTKLVLSFLMLKAENSSFKVVKVPEAKSISLDDFDEVIGSL